MSCSVSHFKTLLPQHKSRPTGCNAAASQQELSGGKRGLGALGFVRTRSVHLAKLPGPGHPSRHGGCSQRRRRRLRVACTVTSTKAHAPWPPRPLRTCQENPRSARHHTPRCPTPVCTNNNAPAQLLGAASAPSHEPQCSVAGPATDWKDSVRVTGRSGSRRIVTGTRMRDASEHTGRGACARHAQLH